MRSTIVMILAALSLIGWGASCTSHEPHCPTEDSCTIDYHGGHWYVHEDTP